MDEMRRLRRDRWLQSQQQQQQNTRQEKDSSPARDMEDGQTASLYSSSALSKSKSDGTTSIINGGEEEEDCEIEVLHVKKAPLTLHSDSKRKRTDSPSTLSAAFGTTSTRSSSSSSRNEAIDLVSSDDEENDCHNTSTIHKKSMKRPRQSTRNPASGSKSSSTTSSQTIRETIIDTTSRSNTNTTVTLCTYNIWFGPAHPARRMAELSSLLSSKPPTLIGLQEVTPELRQELFPLLESIGYHMVCQPNLVRSTDYGVAIGILTTCGPIGGNGHGNGSVVPTTAQLVDSGYRPYSDSIMSRGLLWAHVFLNEQCSIIFTTTHLESFIPPHSYPLPDKENHKGTKRRATQICEARDFCLDYIELWNLDAAFMTGDLNWDDERKRSQGDDSVLLSVLNDGTKGDVVWKDAWLETRHGEEGYTYDSKKSPMLKGNLRRRFDRILSYTAETKQNGQERENSSRSNLKCESSALIGTEAIDGIVWKKEVPEWKYGKPSGKVNIQDRPVLPSDHYGVCATFGSK